MSSSIIQPTDHVLLRLPNGIVKSVQLDKSPNVVAGRIGSFPAKALVGQPYGLSYEVHENTLKHISPPSIQEVEDTDATNELITDGQFVQPLTGNEIEALKEAGVHASEIIKAQIEQHANYSLKTEYSKEKYKKRKEAKYSKSFTTIPPTLFNVCEYWFQKDQGRIRDIRYDSLSQMLNLASLKPGGRYLAVDDASGIVVSGILDRLGGEGRLLTICDTESPPSYPVLVHMNLSQELLSPLSSLNWATAEQDYTSVVADEPLEEARSEKQRVRIQKRKVALEKLETIRAELFAGEFDGLLIASEYDSFSIIEKLTPYLAGSSSIVVHSPYHQLLVDLQMKLRTQPQYLSPNVTECWLRRYQVLPGRTHPTMTTSGTGGFLLQTFRIHDDPNASSILMHRKPKKTKKSEHDQSEEPSAPQTPINADS